MIKKKKKELTIKFLEQYFIGGNLFVIFIFAIFTDLDYPSIQNIANNSMFLQYEMSNFNNYTCINKNCSLSRVLIFEFGKVLILGKSGFP